MGDLSASVQLKLERALQHADEMEQIVRAWSVPRSYNFASAVEDDSDPDFVRLKYFIEVSRALPGGLLGQIVGDSIHNYRCVLDHLIWELSVHHSGPTPKDPLGIKFPSRLTGPGSGGLHAVDPAVVTAVQALHNAFPGSGPTDPSPFLMLCELSNIDKHSTIPIVHHYAKDVQIDVTPVIIGTVIDVVADVGPLDDDTIVARIAIPRPLWNPDTVEVRCRTENGVVIAKTSRTPLVLLGPTMDGIKEAVEEAAKQLKIFLP